MFERWKCLRENSWALTLFKKHNTELLHMYFAFQITKKHTYMQFKNEDKKNWDSPANKYFHFEKLKNNKKPPYFIQFSKVKDWSSHLTEFENLSNLNLLLIISANLEVYISKITRLALLSDFSIILGGEKIDGSKIMKFDNFKKSSKLIDNYIINFTKGTWQSRMNALATTFECLDETELMKFTSTLDKIRKIRNDFAHAFGRDIDTSSKRFSIKSEPITRLKLDTLFKYVEEIKNFTNYIDERLLKYHIGNFEIIHSYHEWFIKLSEAQKRTHINQRGDLFKTEYGSQGANPISKEFARTLVGFYEDL